MEFIKQDTERIPSKDVLEASLINTGPDGNKLIVIHSGAPESMIVRGYGQPSFGKKYDILDLDTFKTVVPDNVIVCLFTPINLLALVGEQHAQDLRCFFSGHNCYELDYEQHVSEEPFLPWIYSTTNSYSKYAKVYFPGDTLYNQQMVFDEEDEFFDIWSLEDNGDCTFGKQDKILKKLSNVPIPIPEHRPLRSDMGCIELGTLTTEYLLDYVKPKTKQTRYDTRLGKKSGIQPMRILYIWSCNPPNDVAAITKLLLNNTVPKDHAELKGAEILKELQLLRKECEERGRINFIEMKNVLGVKTRSDGKILNPSCINEQLQIATCEQEESVAM